jgi:hypothetical protein
VVRKRIKCYFNYFTRFTYRGWWIFLPLWIQVTSLVNVRHTRGEGEVLYVDKLLNEGALEDLETVKARALASPFYPNYVLSTDKKAVVVVETVARI